MNRRVYAEAYEIIGGGFRAIATNSITRETFRGERKDTLEAAKIDAKKAAIRLLNGNPYRTGSYRNHKNNWRMNYWF